VKELIHNGKVIHFLKNLHTHAYIEAIDANATSIEILIDAEKFSLQVNDNGYGIQNLHKIGQRHGKLLSMKLKSKCYKYFCLKQLHQSAILCLILIKYDHLDIEEKVS
jgi:hypothetical protein